MRRERRRKRFVDAPTTSVLVAQIRYMRGLRDCNTAPRRTLRRLGLADKPLQDWTPVDLIRLGSRS